MKTITATELARNINSILDHLEVEHEEIVIEREQRQVARLLPGPEHLTAIDAMSDLYRILPEDTASTWEADSRAANLRNRRLPKGVRDPWAS